MSKNFEIFSVSKYHLGLVEKRYGSSQNQGLTTTPENTCQKYTLEPFFWRAIHMDKLGISEVVTNLATCERAGPPTASNWFPANLLRQMDTSQADDQYHGSGAYSRGPAGP